MNSITAAPQRPTHELAPIALRPGRGRGALVPRRPHHDQGLGRDHRRARRGDRAPRAAGLGLPAARPSPRGRVVLRDRGRADLLGRRRGDRGAGRIVCLRPARDPAHLHRQLWRPGSCSSPSPPASSIHARAVASRPAAGDPSAGHRAARCRGDDATWPPSTASRSSAPRASRADDAHQSVGRSGRRRGDPAVPRAARAVGHARGTGPPPRRPLISQTRPVGLWSAPVSRPPIRAQAWQCAAGGIQVLAPQRRATPEDGAGAPASAARGRSDPRSRSRTPHARRRTRCPAPRR